MVTRASLRREYGRGEVAAIARENAAAGKAEARGECVASDRGRLCSMRGNGGGGALMKGAVVYPAARGQAWSSRPRSGG